MPHQDSLATGGQTRWGRERLGRAFFAVAAVLAAAAAAGLPLWKVSFVSPQYVDNPIRVVLSVGGLSGDFDELDHLSWAIGLRVPRGLPELHLLRPLLLTLVALLLLSAWPRATAGRWLRRAGGFGFAAALAAMLAAGQLRLYALGHGRAHSALAGVADFTPLILGPTHLANFHVLALPAFGGWLLALATGLVVAAIALECSKNQQAAALTQGTGAHDAIASQ